MPSAQDPFYVVKEEIQESIDKLQSTFHQWERIPSDTREQLHLTKELIFFIRSSLKPTLTDGTSRDEKNNSNNNMEVESNLEGDLEEN
ncbi:hypothetical protein SO802_010508 [Lithocarpus litseifolius]|uniref:Syntaxin 6/10/61 N-terminal domain-containing protein n=1 Tax=Lithocarpus litseifolius TaxID=425828 RepID=A0AAW2DK07_9ROSI